MAVTISGRTRINYELLQPLKIDPDHFLRSTLGPPRSNVPYGPKLAI